MFANKGIGAAGSGIFAACLERMLPRDADLVVRCAAACAPLRHALNVTLCWCMGVLLHFLCPPRP